MGEVGKRVGEVGRKGKPLLVGQEASDTAVYVIQWNCQLPGLSPPPGRISSDIKNYHSRVENTYIPHISNQHYYISVGYIVSYIIFSWENYWSVNHLVHWEET